MVDFNKLLEERRKLKMAKKSGRSVKVDMAGVESGGVLIPEGDYIVSVDEITQEEGQSSGKPYLKFVLVVSEGDKKGSKLYHKTSLQPQALFNLKNTLIALGQPVPNKAMNIDLNSLEGESMMVSVGHEVYEGKKRSQVTDVFPLDVGSGEDDAPDFEEMTLAELVAFAKEEEYDLELSAKDMKKVDKVKAAVIEAYESEDEEEEETEEEETEEEDDDAPDFAEMDLKELLAFAEENEYELKLSKKNIKKVDMVRAAVEAAYEADDSEEEEEDDTEERPDLDDMDLKGMLAYAEAEELEIKLSVKNKKNVDKVREALQTIFDAKED